MLEQEDKATIFEELEQEGSRRTYPESFPALPEIPGGRYWDEEYFNLEMKHVWKKTWLSVGHVSEIPEVGSYMLFDKLDLSIIITRDKNDEIRAYHNVCRHRGAPLVLENTGRTKRFTCPYHSWSYNLNGELVAVPQEFNFACLDRTERGLIPVRCEVWRGLIFINLDKDAGNLMEFLGSVPELTNGFPIEKMVVKKTAQIYVDCNWKAQYDNFLEAYHLETVHPKTLQPYLDGQRSKISLLKNGHNRMLQHKKYQNRITGSAENAPPLPEMSDVYEGHLVAFPLFPNVQFGLDIMGFPFQTIWPVGVHKSMQEIKILGWAGEEWDDDDYWSKVLSNLLEIFDEDLRFISKIQQSLEGGFFTGMMLSYMERAIYWYQEELDRKIGMDNIPEHLRIKPVLSAQRFD